MPGRCFMALLSGQDAGQGAWEKRAARAPPSLPGCPRGQSRGVVAHQRARGDGTVPEPPQGQLPTSLAPDRPRLCSVSRGSEARITSSAHHSLAGFSARHSSGLSGAGKHPQVGLFTPPASLWVGAGPLGHRCSTLGDRASREAAGEAAKVKVPSRTTRAVGQPSPYLSTLQPRLDPVPTSEAAQDHSVWVLLHTRTLGWLWGCHPVPASPREAPPREMPRARGCRAEPPAWGSEPGRAEQEQVRGRGVRRAPQLGSLGAAAFCNANGFLFAASPSHANPLGLVHFLPPVPDLPQPFFYLCILARPPPPSPHKAEPVPGRGWALSRSCAVGIPRALGGTGRSCGYCNNPA